MFSTRVILRNSQLVTLKLISGFRTTSFNSLEFDEFKGLSGESPCLAKSISGPEPVYQNLNPNMYKTYEHNQSFSLMNGGVLPKIQLAYETWGQLNESKDNAILLFTGLSANSHAKSNSVCINRYSKLNCVFKL